MQDAGLFFRNNVLISTLQSGAEVSGLGAGNIASPHGNAAEAWQTPVGTLTGAAGAYVVFDARAEVTWRAYWLARTNLTSAATVRWRVWTEANYPSGATEYDSTALSGTVDADVEQSFLVAASNATGRYARCDIDDAANPDGFISVALAYAGAMWQPAANIGRDTRYVPERVETGATTRGGSEFTRFHYRRRGWEVDLAWVEEAEAIAEMMELDRVMSRGVNVGFVRDPSSSIASAEAVFGRGYSLQGFGFPTTSTAYRNWRVRITERL